jgi:D-serine deaminase-like pyridoxal phosphate-dependent protein
MVSPPHHDSLATLLAGVRRPTLLLDEARARANIRRMAARMREVGVRLRPHFKTHVSATVGEWFRDEGIDGITVTSAEMARYFADAGWRDLTIAIPVNPRQIGELRSLARATELGLLVDDVVTARALARDLGAPARVWLKIDAGYGRAGIPWDAPRRALEVIDELGAGSELEPTGLLAHAGDSYAAASPDDIRAVHARTVERLGRLRGELQRPLQISIGDTPGCTLGEDFDGVDEARPGNFVFHDLMQLELGVCTAEQIAVAVACPVIGRYPARDQLLIHGGAIHFSKDRLAGPDGTDLFGYLARPHEGSFGPPERSVRLTSVSQEHGVLTADGPLPDDLQVGDVALVLPVHSCLTAHQFPGYLTLDGEFVERAPLAEPRV